MLYVLEQKSRAGITSPALDTFIMSGFESESDCVKANPIIGSSTRVRISTLDKYLTKNKYPRFRDETGSAGVVKKVKDSYTTFPLTEMTSRLIRSDIMMIDVLEGREINGVYNYSQEDMNMVLRVNDVVKEMLLLGKDYCGSFIYQTHAGLKSSLMDFISDAIAMRPGVRFLVVHINPTMKTMIEVENAIYSCTHESVVITGDDTIYQLEIADSKLSLSVLDVPDIVYRLR